MKTRSNTSAIIAFNVLIPAVLFTGCIGNNNKVANRPVNLKDTLYEKHFLRINNGDTTWQDDTIYFMSTDPTIDTSQYYYTACNSPCSSADMYRVFFQQQKVIAFCDSMIKMFPLPTEEAYLVFSHDKSFYETVKEHATNGMEAVFADELATLLHRFNPFIENKVTGDKPGYVIIKNEDHKASGAYYTYHIRTKTGDTVLLAMITIRPIALEDIERK